MADEGTGSNGRGESLAMRLKFRVMPRERQLFAVLRQIVANVQEGLHLLNHLLADSTEFGVEARRLRDLEHRGDELTHHLVRQLDSTFVTPVDRGDMYALAAGLDDVLDLADEVADVIVLDRIDSITAEAKQLGEILVEIGQHYP